MAGLIRGRVSPLTAGGHQLNRRPSVAPVSLLTTRRVGPKRQRCSSAELPLRVNDRLDMLGGCIGGPSPRDETFCTRLRPRSSVDWSRGGPYASPNLANIAGSIGGSRSGGTQSVEIPVTCESQSFETGIFRITGLQTG
jgi:hypothetical protein